MGETNAGKQKRPRKIPVKQGTGGTEHGAASGDQNATPNAKQVVGRRDVAEVPKADQRDAEHRHALPDFAARTLLYAGPVRVHLGHEAECGDAI